MWTALLPLKKRLHLTGITTAEPAGTSKPTPKQTANSLFIAFSSNRFPQKPEVEIDGNGPGCQCNVIRSCCEVLNRLVHGFVSLYPTTKLVLALTDSPREKVYEFAKC